jgi:hypothetical protein
MPTNYPRIQSTRTPSVDHALAVGARYWPDLDAGPLLARLAEHGAAALESEAEARPSARLHRFPARGVTITQATIEAALDED